MEVPILGSDSVKWIEVPIPSSFAATADADIPSTCTPLSRDCASSIAIGDPPTYLIWYFLTLLLISNFLHFPIVYIHFFFRLYCTRRIHRLLPRTLELLELCANKEFPKLGLRITFPEALSPLVFLCKNEVFCFQLFLFFCFCFPQLSVSATCAFYELQIDIASRSHPYLLCALTVSGVAYLVRLGTISSYASRSVIRPEDLIEFNLHGYGPITSAAATPSGCLVVGRNDGSLACFQLGTLDSTAPGIINSFGSLIPAFVY